MAKDRALVLGSADFCDDRYVVRHMVVDSIFEKKRLKKHSKGRGMAEIIITDRLNLGSRKAGVPLTIFQRPGHSKNRRVIVFLHGLGGSSFGDRRTWVGLPEHIWDQMRGADVGFYSYRTLFARLKFWRSYDIRTECDLLADELAGCGYEEVVLIGHSLGGVIARYSISAMHKRGMRDLLKRISAVLLLASPTGGSRWAPSTLAPLARFCSRDFCALTFNGPVSSEIRTTFEGVIDPKLGRPMSESCIPVFALIACEDFWVKRLSATTAVPAVNQRLMRKSHTEITKGSDTSAWVSDVISRVFEKTEPAARLRVTRNNHEVRPARLADYAAMNQLSQAYFGVNTPDEVFADVLAIDPQSFGVVRLLGGLQLKGYWCVLPLLPDVAAAIKRGALAAADIRGSSIAGPRDEVGAIYVGAIVAVDSVSKGLVMREIQARLRDLRHARDVEILARAATEDGLRLIEQHGLAPIRAEGINQVYSGVTAISRRGRRRA